MFEFLGIFFYDFASHFPSSSRCIVLPHIGSATEETRSAMAVLAAQNVIAGMGLSLGGGHEPGVIPEELDLSRYT